MSVRRDWAGRTISDTPIAYINRTGDAGDAVAGLWAWRR
jgi:hypothetical protein